MSCMIGNSSIAAHLKVDPARCTGMESHLLTAFDSGHRLTGRSPKPGCCGRAAGRRRLVPALRRPALSKATNELGADEPDLIAITQSTEFRSNVGLNCLTSCKVSYYCHGVPRESTVSLPHGLGGGTQPYTGF